VAEPVDLSIQGDGRRARIRLYHPKGNIITALMVSRLRECFAGLAGHPHLRLVTIEGAGADFSFGADVDEHRREVVGDVLPEMHRMLQDLLAVPAPTAAVVRGRCLGGGFEIALACDAILAASDAVFGLPEIALGVFPPAASVLLGARVGQSRATRAILTGEITPAAAWQEAGLLEAVVPRDELDAAVDAWFERLASSSAVALRYATAASRWPLRSDMRRRLPELERLYLDRLMATADPTEGVMAFLEKRPPVWRDE
jgi:cyclohexa-1,5-dienecarbonyl-CoA hydratase